MAMSTAADLTQTSTCVSLARGRDPRKNRRSCEQRHLITDQQKWSHPRKPTARDLGLGLGLARTGDEAMGNGLGPGFSRTGDEAMGIGLGLGFASNRG